MTRTKRYQSGLCLGVNVLGVLGALRGQGSHTTLSCTDVQHFQTGTLITSSQLVARAVIFLMTALKVLIF